MPRCDRPRSAAFPNRKFPVSANKTQPPAEDSAKTHRRVPRWAVWSMCGVLFVGGMFLAWGVAKDGKFTTAPIQGYEIVNVYPHDANAFSQGLAFDGEGNLYEGTGLYGESSLRKVDLKTGEPDRNRHLLLGPHVFGEGIAVVDDTIVQLTWRNNFALVYDLKTFEQQKRIPYRGEGWGLTYDGKQLIMSDGSSRLRFVNPKNFRLNKLLRVTDGRGEVGNLNELEYVEGEIYANVWHTNRIARISPETGKVLGWIDLSGLLKPGDATDPQAVLNGIAYDAKHKKLYVTGKKWPKLFEIRVRP